MNPKRLHHHWRDSLEARLDSIRKLRRHRRPLSATEVHDLRVALRRVRLLAGLGAHSIGKAKARQFRETTRVLLKAFDRLRDCDVALDWLGEVNASPALIARLSRSRNLLWFAARKRWRACAPVSIAIDSGGRHDAKKLVRQLDKHLQAAARRCQKTVQRGAEIPTVELHALRRVVRRWRYLRELQLTARAIRRDARLRLLIRVQECLGALQNTEVILDLLQPLGRAKELRSLRAGLRANLSHQRREALHQIKSLPVSG